MQAPQQPQLAQQQLPHQQATPLAHQVEQQQQRQQPAVVAPHLQLVVPAEVVLEPLRLEQRAAPRVRARLQQQQVALEEEQQQVAPLG